jgi:hypothetical protein
MRWHCWEWLKHQWGSKHRLAHRGWVPWAHAEWAEDGCANSTSPNGFLFSQKINSCSCNCNSCIIMLRSPTVSLHFGTPELHSFPMKPCVCLAALRCRGSCSVVNMLDLSNIESNCMRRRLDRTGIRRWILNFCCIHTQMMLRQNSRQWTW